MNHGGEDHHFQDILLLTDEILQNKDNSKKKMKENSCLILYHSWVTVYKTQEWWRRILKSFTCQGILLP
jgi:hypothetical protein